MADTEWWQRGPVDGVPALLQPVAHILLQVRESVGELVDNLTEAQWNARPAGVASAAFHVRHITGVIDRLFTYARGQTLSAEQFAAIKLEGAPVSSADVPTVLNALSARVVAAIAELRTIDVATLGGFLSFALKCGQAKTFLYATIFLVIHFSLTRTATTARSQNWS